MTTEQGAYLIQNNLELSQSAMQKAAYIERLEAENEQLRKRCADLDSRYTKLCTSYKAKCGEYKKLYRRYLDAGHDQTIIGEMIDRALPAILSASKVVLIFCALMAAGYLLGNM